MHNFRIKKQITEVDYLYADISIDVILTNDELLLVNEVAKEWDTAIRFGVLYFYDHFRKLNNKGLFITVVNFKEMTIDTSHFSVFYATIMVLSKALNFPINNFELDTTNGNLIVPYNNKL